MPASESSQDKAAYRRMRVAEHYLKGVRQNKIALMYGVCQDTISRDMEMIREEWRAARVGFIDRAVSEEIEKIDQVEREAWEAWERSCRPAKTTTITEDADGNAVTKIERRESAGDPRFLALVDKSIEQRRKLLGLDAPTKTESSINATVLHYQPPPTREEVAEKISELVQRIRAPSTN